MVSSTSWADEVEEAETRSASAVSTNDTMDQENVNGSSESGSGSDQLAKALDQSALVSENDGQIDVDAADKVVLPSAELNPEGESSDTKIEKILVDDAPPGTTATAAGNSAATPVHAKNTIYASAKTFEELPISKELIQGLYSEMNFERPSRIQAESLPLILQPPYTDLIAQAHNGSGKTTCFVLSMLSRVDTSINAPQALCMCPTRELVVQNVAVCKKMGKYSGITVMSTATDSSNSREKRTSVITEHVVFGTVGRIWNWATKPPRPLALQQIKLLVFDEADHMLESDGFRMESTKIIERIRKATNSSTSGRSNGSNFHDSRHQSKLQILLFSATFSETVKAFAERVSPRANKIFVQKEKLSLEVIKQFRVKVPSPEQKSIVLRQKIIPYVEKAGQMIIFLRRKIDARNLHAEFEKDGFLCTSIHGDLQPEQRDRVIEEFRAGTTKLLIATDILARGFDQANVNFVCNYDPPTDRAGTPSYETYLHRIGRSARFGRKGIAFNFTSGVREASVIDDISRHYQKDIKEIKWDDEDGFIEAIEEAGLA